MDATSEQMLDHRDAAERIRGGLLGGLIGDAMGAATEMRTPRQIRARYGWVASFLPPEDGTFAAGRSPGLITDDSMMSLLIVDKIIATSGNPTTQDAAEVVLDWASDEAVLRFAGPSTKRSIERLRQGQPPETAGAPDPTDNDLRASNGAAMKAAPAGYAAIGDIERAIELATTFAVPTHNSDVGFSGAAAVAAAVAHACGGTDDLAAVLDAGIAGAERGLDRGRARSIEVPAASVAKRIQLAIDIAEGRTRWEPTVESMGEIIGSGLPIVEAVPLAFGLVRLADGHAVTAIEAAVNLGDDADTVATIAGSIAGAFSGSKSIDPDLSAEVLQVNGLDLDARIQALLRLQDR